MQQVDQEQIELDIPQETTLEELRELLISQYSYPPGHMIFLFNGEILKDADSLSHLNENSLITVYIKNKPKKCHKKSRKSKDNPTPESAQQNEEEAIKSPNEDLNEEKNDPKETNEEQASQAENLQIEEKSNDNPIEDQTNNSTNDQIPKQNETNENNEKKEEKGIKKRRKNFKIENDDDPSTGLLNFPFEEDPNLDDDSFLLDEQELLANLAETFKKIHLKEMYDSNLHFYRQLNETKRIADIIEHNPALKFVIEQNICQNYTVATEYQTVDANDVLQLAGFNPIQPTELEDPERILLFGLTSSDREQIRYLFKRFGQPLKIIIEKYFEANQDLEMVEALLKSLD